MKFYKYHALGNDYLVLDPENTKTVPNNKNIRRICHRNYGLGSDGILYGPENSNIGDFGLRIFNPDGSEAEKSGNGLRIFARYLLDCGRVSNTPFTISTVGGLVTCQIHENGNLITVDMGNVSFNSDNIPVTGTSREVINEAILLEGKEYKYSAATIGNPHCILPLSEISEKTTKYLGPILENHPLFPNRTNVQFLKVINRKNIQIEIWERGAGYTLASGSSSSAAAAVAHRLGMVDNDVTVHMPGGHIMIHIGENFSITMIGPVTYVGIMLFDEEALR